MLPFEYADLVHIDITDPDVLLESGCVDVLIDTRLYISEILRILYL